MAGFSLSLGKAFWFQRLNMEGEKVVPSLWQQTWSWEVQCWSWTYPVSSANSAILFWASAGHEDWLLFNDIILTSSNFKSCSYIFNILIFSIENLIDSKF